MNISQQNLFYVGNRINECLFRIENRYHLPALALTIPSSKEYRVESFNR